MVVLQSSNYILLMDYELKMSVEIDISALRK
jgi:hypothetical protein